MRILISGDLHIGRRSSRLPDGTVVDGRRHSAAAGWNRLVDLCAQVDAQLLVLAGDVVDAAQRVYEALGPLEHGLDRLAERGTRVLAVAGNHDHRVLPQLADRLGPARLTLLGRGGRWERHSIEEAGRAVLHVDGWSFPSAHHAADPLPEAWPFPVDGVPVLAVAHGDIDTAGSPYAPMRRAALRGAPVNGWAIGHVHASMLQKGDATAPFVLVPGSPQALDPGERGAHGAWQVDLDDGRLSAPMLRPLSTVRYDEVRVDADGHETADDLDGAAIEALRVMLQAATAEGGAVLETVLVRLVLEGRSAVSRAERTRILQGIDDDLELRAESAQLLVEKATDACRPAVDIAAVAAQGSTAPAVLARLVLDLDRRPELREASTQRLLDEARRVAHRAVVARAFAGVTSASQAEAGTDGEHLDPQDAGALARRLRAQAVAMLGALLEQQA